jgi:hypothetical protein
MIVKSNMEMITLRQAISPSSCSQTQSIVLPEKFIIISLEA